MTKLYKALVDGKKRVGFVDADRDFIYLDNEGVFDFSHDYSDLEPLEISDPKEDTVIRGFDKKTVKFYLEGGLGASKWAEWNKTTFHLESLLKQFAKPLESYQWDGVYHAKAGPVAVPPQYEFDENFVLPQPKAGRPFKVVLNNDTSPTISPTDKLSQLIMDGKVYLEADRKWNGAEVRGFKVKVL
jgi:hypothetical protein